MTGTGPGSPGSTDRSRECSMPSSKGGTNSVTCRETQTSDPVAGRDDGSLAATGLNVVLLGFTVPDARLRALGTTIATAAAATLSTATKRPTWRS